MAVAGREVLLEDYLLLFENAYRKEGGRETEATSANEA